MKNFKDFLLEISSSTATNYIQKAAEKGKLKFNSPSHRRATDIALGKAYNKKSSGCIGNCVTSFSRNTGETKNKHLPYRDVSHFAHSEENAREITRKEFEKHHPLNDKMKKIADKPTTRFLHDKEHAVHMIHDTDKDVHHFFVSK